MPRTALIQNGVVAQIVVTGDGYTPPDGFTAVATDTANIGDSYSDGAFTAAVQPIPLQQQLINYATRKQQRIASSGCAINVAPSGHPEKLVLTDTSAVGRADLASLVQLSSFNPNFETLWVQSTGALTLNATEIMTLALAAAAWVESGYQTLAAVTAAIQAGQIATNYEVDHLPTGIPPWPSNT